MPSREAVPPGESILYKQKYFIFSFFFLLSNCLLTAQEKPEDLQISPESLLAMLNEDMQMMPVFDNLLKDLNLINDEQDRKFLAEALQNPELLKDSQDQQKFDLLMERFNAIKLLNSIKDKVKEAQSHAKVSYWLSEQNLLDGEDIKEEIEKIVTQVEKDGIAFAKRVSDRSDTAQDSLTIFYTIYRKFRLLRALETVSAITNTQKRIDWIASWLYMGLGAMKTFGRAFYHYKLMEKYKRAGDEQKAQICVQNMMNSSGPAMNSISYAGEMNEDDYARYADKKIKSQDATVEAQVAFEVAEKVPEIAGERLAEARLSVVEGDEANAENLVELAVGDRDAAERRRDIAVRERDKDGARLRAKSLDFFDTFDTYLDRRLEQKLNGILVHIKIPKILRKVFLSNRASRFLREIMLFKMLPTSAYWYGKKWLSGEQGGDFSSSDLLRGAVKSAGHLAEKRTVSFIVDTLNGEGDEFGIGRLDKAKKYTLGIVGPNLVKLGGKLVTPQAMLALFNSEVDGEDGREHFLEERDYHMNPDKTFEQRVAKKTSKYLASSAVSFLTLKLLSKCRGKVFGWFGRRLKSFSDLLVRRGWIDPETVQGAEIAGMFVQQLGLPILMYNYFWHDKLLTRFDQMELQAEMARTGDQFVLLDYLFSAWVGKKAGRAFAGWLERSKLAT